MCPRLFPGNGPAGGIVPDLSIIEGKVFLDSTAEGCLKIKEAFPSPLMLIDSEPEGKGWARAVSLGAGLYLRKPVVAQELVARARALQRRTTKRQ